jgi:teichuronic acid biosynthesis protein TuaE
MLSVSLWEILTSNHLPVASFFNHAPVYIQFQSATFYTNPNDYMAIFTLMFIWYAVYEKLILKKIDMFTYIFFISSIIISFINNSRIAMIVLLITASIIFLNKKSIFKLTIFNIVLVGLFAYLINWEDSDIQYLFNGLTFGGDSASIRQTLYKWAILSIDQNYGFGLGVNNSANYYLSISDPNLGGIINPHNYLLEILINSGILVTFLYIILNGVLIYLFLKKRLYHLVYMVIMYQIILISSSSSLFLWFHYVYFIGIIALYYVSRLRYGRKIKESISLENSEYEVEVISQGDVNLPKV